MSAKDTGHRFTDHTADLSIEAWAPTEEALLAELARAVVGVLTEDAALEGLVSRSVSVEGIDAEDRLVCWLNEVIWLALVEGFLLVDAEITLSGTSLAASVRGRGDAAGLIRTEVKSATYHGLSLAREDMGRYVARVVIDV